MFANEPRGAIDLDHGEPSAGGGNRIALSCVSLLSSPQCVEFSLESVPIDRGRCFGFAPHDVISTHFGWGVGSAA